MFKKLAAVLALVALSVAGLVGISAPAAAAGSSTDATLSTLEVHSTSINDQRFWSEVSMRQFQSTETYYDVYSTVNTIGIYLKTTDSTATVAVTGGDAHALAYTLNVSAGIIPQPQVISNSLTSVSTGGGTAGVMYIKNYTPCSTINFMYNYKDANGDVQTSWENVNTNFLNTDLNDVSRVVVNYYGSRNTFRDDSIVADLVVANDANQGCVGYYGGGAYADTTVPKSVHFFNPTVTSTTMPATVSQNTAFKISGPGINAGSYLSVYLLNPATGDSLWTNWSFISNDSMLVTVSGGSNDSEWLQNQNLQLVVEQWADEDMNPYPNPDHATLYTKDVKFTPQMASQVSVSPAKGPVAGGNKVTITGHGICNPTLETYATIKIAGTEVSDLQVQNCDFLSSSNYTAWDGVSKATFIVPAGAAGAADITVDIGYGPTTLSQKYIYGAKPTVGSITPSSVATTGGSMITLAGTNFGVSGTPVVIIDGVKSPYVVRQSSTKVLAMVPAHSATGDVTVDIISSSGGGSLDTPATLKYVARGTNPTVTAIAPAKDGVSGGNEIKITGTGFSTSATGVTFGGVAAKVTAATATSLTVETPSADAAGVVDVVVGTPTGLVTKAGAFTYVADNGVTHVSPSTIASYATAAEAKVTITGVGFGTAGKITVGSGSAVDYTATANGTTISDVAIPTTAEGSVSISITPTGAKKPYTTSVTITAPKVTFAGPADYNTSNPQFGDANPWIGFGWGTPLNPTNNGGLEQIIQGTGFGTAGTIKIGTVTVPTSFYSDTLIKFVSPSSFAAGTYDLTVAPSVGTLTAVVAKTFVIGKQLATPVIASVLANTDPNRGDPLDYFYALTTDSDLYTVTGTGFLGSDAGVSTKVSMESNSDYYSNSNFWAPVDVVSMTDTQIVIHAPRTYPLYDYAAMRIVTNDTVITTAHSIYYTEVYVGGSGGGGASISPYNGLCNKDAIGTYNPAVVTLSDPWNSSFSTGGVAKLDGVVIPRGAITTWNSTTIVINFDLQTAIHDVWGQKQIQIFPNDGSDEQDYGFNCAVDTTITTKLNGGTTPITVAAGTAFTPSAVMNNMLPGTTFVEPADNYEFRSTSGGYAKGLPVRAGDYWVRARVGGSIYDTSKYNYLGTPSEVKVTITGTAITLTPKLLGSATSPIVYKGQLGDGTGGTSSDIGYASSITPADPITAITYQYRNHACTANGWNVGLPKNVAVVPQSCGGNGTDVGSWDIMVRTYEMRDANGVDQTFKYIPTFEVFNLVINKKDVTLSTVKAEKTYDGSNSVTLNDITLTGAIEGESPLLDQAFARGATFADATAGTNKPVTLGGSFKLAGIFDVNYHITNPDMAVTGNIKKANAELKLTSPVSALVLGQTPTVELTLSNTDTKTHQNPIADAQIAAPVLVSKATGVCTLSGTTVTPVAPGLCVIDVTQAASTNYNAGVSYHFSPDTLEEITIKIFGAPKDVAVVADDAKVVTGDSYDPSVSVTGLLDGDSFDGTAFDYYQGSTLLSGMPTAIGTYKIVPRDGSVTTQTPAAYNSTIKYVAGKLIITAAPPVITNVSPTHGPEAGGGTLTITGTGLGALTSITLGGVTLRKPNFTVNGDGTKVTFTIPAGTGGLDIALNAGTAEADTSYTYDAPFHAVADVPNNGNGSASADLSLALKLKLAVGSKLEGQNVGIQGGGLKAGSTYTLTMHSNPVMIYTGTTDADGNFKESVKIPAKACLAAGEHSLTLTGITPAGEPTSDTAKFALVDACIVGATAEKTGDKEWTLSGFLFDYCSATLTKGGKKSLDALVNLIKGAKTVTIKGYTETDTKSDKIKKSNLILAKARTVSVEKYLKSKGIKAKWVTIGKGGVDPVSTKDQSKNRRVVIQANF